ncbi:hypothetical protein Tco_1182331 [Tanacetum coccineum]
MKRLSVYLFEWRVSLNVHKARGRKRNPGSIACLKGDEKKLDGHRVKKNMKSTEADIDLLKTEKLYAFFKDARVLVERLSWSRNWKDSKSSTEIRSLLGLAGSLRRFLRISQKIAKPLLCWIKKNKTLLCGAISKMKLSHSEGKLAMLLLATPERANAWGTVIAYASRQLKKMRKFIPTHDPGIWDGWIELLSDYECEIKLPPGQGNLVMADAFSRIERLKQGEQEMGVPVSIISAERAIRVIPYASLLQMTWDNTTYEYGYHLETVGRSEHTIQDAEYMLRACDWILVAVGISPVIWNKWEKQSFFDQKLCKNEQKRLFRITIGRLKTARVTRIAMMIKGCGWTGCGLSVKLPQELSCVHDTFHVSNLKKCLAEPDVQVPLDEIEIDENLRFVEEPIEIIATSCEKKMKR